MKKIIFIVSIVISFMAMSCKKDSTYQGSGSVVFYTATNTHGSIAITVSGGKINPVTFTVPVTNDPDKYCTNGYTGYVYLDIGNYTYSATAADATKWSGTVDITKDYCLQRKLQ